MILRISICSIFLVLTSYAVAENGDFSTNTLDAFKQLFPGRYDNGNERACAEALNESRLPTRLHCVISHANIRVLKELHPNVTSETFFIEQFRNNDPGDIYRRRVYHVISSGEQLVMKVYHLVNGSRYRNAQHRPGLLENLQVSDLEYSKGCDILWDRRGERRFLSSMFQDRCISKWNGVPILARDSNILTAFYMTMDFQFYNPSTMELVGTSRFNMSRLLQGDAPVTSLLDVRAALEEGRRLRLTADLQENCPQMGTEFTTEVDDWSFVNRSGSTFTLAARTRWFNGKDMIETQVLTLLIGPLLGGGYRLRMDTEGSFYCTAIREKLSMFISSPHSLTPLGHHGDLRRAVLAGDVMNFVLDYKKCIERVPKTLWDAFSFGGRVKNAYIAADGSVVFHPIPPYTEAAYNECRLSSCPVHKISVHPDGQVSVIIRVQRRNLDAHYKRDCQLHGQHPGGALRVFSVAGSDKPTLCFREAGTQPVATERPSGGATAVQTGSQGYKVGLVTVLGVLIVGSLRG